MRLKVLVTAIVLLSTCLAARADDIYTFTVNLTLPYGLVGTYTFDEPSIVTTAGYLSLSDLTSYSGAAIRSFYLNPDSFTCPHFISPGAQSCIEIEPVSGIVNSFAGSEALNAPGMYDENVTALYVTITDTSSNPSPTPEPSSIFLLSTGLLGAAGALKSRFVSSPHITHSPRL
ncbi:MAG TPA: PEP-CTERM sorting domain-containing protein [Acidobacteriaceae bacterium]|nr:PEP-CTERM sorting domain-containing protein [Acidobacteriaceae bacterium]